MQANPAGEMPPPAPERDPADEPAPVGAGPLPPGPELPLGEYGSCFYWLYLGGNAQLVPTTLLILIEPGNQYLASHGEGGRYHYDDATGVVTWLDGGLQGFETTVSATNQGTLALHVYWEDNGDRYRVRCPH